MQAGLQVFTDQGVAQIDSNYRNFRFSRKFTLSSTNDPNWPLRQKINFSVPETPCLVVAESTSSDTISLDYVIVEGDSTAFQWHFYNVSSSRTATFYIFTVTPPQQLGTFGLEVFNDQGSLVYGSYTQYLKVVDFFPSITDIPNGQLTYPSGRRYGVAQMAVSAFWAQTSMQGGPCGSGFFTISQFYGARGFRTNSQGVFFNANQYSPGPMCRTSGLAGFSYASPGSPLLIIDITDL